MKNDQKGFEAIELMIVVAILGILLAVVLPVIGSVIGFYRGYSDGDRIGTFYKFSYKGIIKKGWEGELLLGGVDDKGQPIKWDFSIYPGNNPPDPLKIKELLGKRVKATYVQWLSRPWTHDSDYELLSMTAITQ